MGRCEVSFMGVVLFSEGPLLDTLVRPPLGPIKMSWLEGWPHFGKELVLQSLFLSGLNTGVATFRGSRSEGVHCTVVSMCRRTLWSCGAVRTPRPLSTHSSRTAPSWWPRPETNDAVWHQSTPHEQNMAISGIRLLSPPLPTVPSLRTHSCSLHFTLRNVTQCNAEHYYYEHNETVLILPLFRTSRRLRSQIELFF